MDQDIGALVQKVSELEAKIDKVYSSSEKLRKYFLWTGIVTLALILIPALILPFVIPAFLQSVTIPTGAGL